VGWQSRQWLCCPSPAFLLKVRFGFCSQQNQLGSGAFFMTNQNLKILLVDDEKSILEVLREVFWEKGFFQTACFSDPALALDYLLNNDIDILITDLKMPLVDGMELAGMALKKGVKKVIMISGSFFGEGDGREKEITGMGIKTIRKDPFMVSNLLRHVF
jgi:CheY-like chemotaxis protein